MKHEYSCFLTCTYDEEHLPSELDKTHVPKLIRAIRKKYPHRTIRYYACGEYGENTLRPHYHVLLFGMDWREENSSSGMNLGATRLVPPTPSSSSPLGKSLASSTTDTHASPARAPAQARSIGNNLYISDELNEIWGKGTCTAGELNATTIEYATRYVTKKVTKGNLGYVRVDEATGEITEMQRPFAVMSLRPAIGAKTKHQTPVEAYGDLIKGFYEINGRKYEVPRYLLQQIEKHFPKAWEKITEERKKNAKPMSDQELTAREENLLANLTQRDLRNV